MFLFILLLFTYGDRVMASKKLKKIKKNCKCGGDCFDKSSALPGYLLAGLGLVALPANFGLLGPALRAWPLFAVLLGAVLVVKVTLCKKHTRGN